MALVLAAVLTLPIVEASMPRRKPSRPLRDTALDALVQDGVNASMLTAKGYGQAKPIASNDTADGRLQNRRTEFTVAGGAGTTASH